MSLSLCLRIISVSSIVAGTSTFWNALCFETRIDAILVVGIGDSCLVSAETAAEVIDALPLAVGEGESRKVGTPLCARVEERPQICDAALDRGGRIVQLMGQAGSERAQRRELLALHPRGFGTA